MIGRVLDSVVAIKSNSLILVLAAAKGSETDGSVV